MKILEKTLIIKKKGRSVMYALKIIAYILVIIGAINWGLVGFFGFDLVAAIFGEMTLLARIVYGLVGISALILLFVNRDIYNHDI
jgi:uncharacterized membrane protein YuzA (DUF378 family)